MILPKSYGLSMALPQKIVTDFSSPAKRKRLRRWPSGSSDALLAQVLDASPGPFHNGHLWWHCVDDIGVNMFVNHHLSHDIS